MLLLQLLLHLRGLFSSAGAWTSFHLNSLCSQSTVALLANDVTHEASQRFEIRVPTCLRVFTVHIKDFAAASWLAISTRAAEKQLSAKWRMTKKIIQWNKYTSVKTHSTGWILHHTSSTANNDKESKSWQKQTSSFLPLNLLHQANK